MDMTWIDTIKDPEPKRRVIYNADDYDATYGNPYYRENNPDSDSLWHHYQKTDMGITFDEYVEETRQADWEEETGDLRDYFNGDKSTRSAFENPLGGNPIIAFGDIARWDGERGGLTPFDDFDSLLDGADSPFKDCMIDRIWDENGRLFIDGHHHDGFVHVELRQLTDQGVEALEAYDESGLDEPFDAGGRRYTGDDESVHAFFYDLISDRHLSEEPRYLEQAFDNKPTEWGLDERVTDFTKHMDKEYGRLYNKGVTGIKGAGDFERWSAFVDDHIDFVRAVVKARGEEHGLSVDPISSDREIAAFLNTYDMLAAMPENDASMTRTEGMTCDPADPSHLLDNGPAVGMTR